MCAIAGLIDLPCTPKTVEKMLKTMLRRGPDGSGVYENGCTLLHSRLAIVDPSGGAQPMCMQDGSEEYALVYNGELYNTQELRSTLQALGHSFKTHSDTEVVLHAYAQWKDQCVERFNGIFGLAVWERRKKRLFLARDRMGVKPLFYALHQGGLLFASEQKTILCYPGFRARLDREGAAQMLLLGPGRIPGSGLFRDIAELEPGCCGYYENGRMEIHRYWKLQDGEHTESFEETARQVEYLVTDAIGRQMVCDVPLGTFLSGGLDSSLISAVCAGVYGKALPTFSVDYENSDAYFVPGKFQPESDNKYIAVMQQFLQSNHQWTVLTPEELANTLEEATIARDAPGMADVDFSLLAFCKQIRPRVKMALSGECADELFGGYPWYRDPQVRERDGFPWAQNTSLRAEFLSPELRQGFPWEDFVQSCYRDTLNQSDILPDNSPQERRMKEMVNLNVRWFMQTLLERKDRMSMHCGLEVRVPFCDYRIAQYLYKVPWEYKDYQGREKGLLRYAMRSFLPEQVLYRKKSPYPKTFDPRYQELMEQEIRQLLQRKDAPIFAIVDARALEKLLTLEQSWPWYGQLMKGPQTMAYFLQMDFWMRHYQVEFVV